MLMLSVFRQLDHTAAPKKEGIPGAPTKEELEQAEGIELQILEAHIIFTNYSSSHIVPAKCPVVLNSRLYV